MSSQSEYRYDNKGGEPWSSHWYLYRWLSALDVGTRVLDIGTAQGIVGRSFSDAGLILRGIEANPQWAAIARPYYDEIMATALEEAPDDFLRGHDVIILADVLEHLAAPWSALERLVKLQPDDAQFIISVPNVANLWVRLNLLCGKFDYQERGILDRTHLRFFTRSTLKQLLTGADLEILQITPTPLPLGLVNRFFRENPGGRAGYGILNHLTRAVPTVLAYQFVVRAVKTAPEGSHDGRLD